MPTPEVWGPPTWTLFHVMSEKVNEKAYPLLCDKMLTMIKLICKNLPCPYCATDATNYLNSSLSYVGRNIPHIGLKIDITTQAADNSTATITVRK